MPRGAGAGEAPRCQQRPPRNHAQGPPGSHGMNQRETRPWWRQQGQKEVRTGGRDQRSSESSCSGRYQFKRQASYL